MSNRGADPADLVSILAGHKAKATRDFVSTAAAVGTIAAGIALFEVALIPGMVIGAAAVLAPKYVPELRRRLPRLLTLPSAVRASPRFRDRAPNHCQQFPPGSQSNRQ